jgi:flagellar biogenesis protein FliO
MNQRRSKSSRPSRTPAPRKGARSSVSPRLSSTAVRQQPTAAGQFSIAARRCTVAARRFSVIVRQFSAVARQYFAAVCRRSATLLGRAWELLVTAWYGARRFQQSRTAAKRMRLEETISLGPKRFIALVRVDGHQLLIGGGAQEVALLANLGQAEPFGPVLQKTSLAAARKPEGSVAEFKVEAEKWA